MSVLLPSVSGRVGGAFKLSQFCVRFEVDDHPEYSTVLLSTDTGAIAALSPMEGQLLGSALDGLGDCTLAERARVAEFVELGFLTPAGNDEVLAFRTEREKRRRTAGVSLTIAPTLSCNFGCDYCFQGQNKPSGQMSHEVQDRLFSRVEEELGRSPGPISVTWYGGEPLAGWPVVSRLSSRFQELAKSRGVPYHANMVSNASLISTRRAKRMAEIGISLVQVTIDGAREIHDQRRTFLSGKGSFDQVMAGVRALVEAGVRVSIRVNIDKRNQAQGVEILAFLASEGFGIKNGVSVYFAPVQSMTPLASAAAEFESVSQEYALAEVQLSERASELGLHAPTILPYMAGLCGAVNPKSFVVLPSGELHKCWDTVNIPDEAVGDITQLKMAASKWDDFEPTDNPVCRSCRLLPACGGACAHKHVNTSLVGGEAMIPCPSFKYSLRERVQLWFKTHGVDLELRQLEVGALSTQGYSPADHLSGESQC